MLLLFLGDRDIMQGQGILKEESIVMGLWQTLSKQSR